MSDASFPLGTGSGPTHADGPARFCGRGPARCDGTRLHEPAGSSAVATGAAELSANTTRQLTVATAAHIARFGRTLPEFLLVSRAMVDTLTTTHGMPEQNYGNRFFTAGRSGRTVLARLE